MMTLKINEEDPYNNPQPQTLYQKWAKLKQKCYCSSPVLVVILFSFVVTGLILNWLEEIKNGDSSSEQETLMSSFPQDDPALIEYIRGRIEPPPKEGANALDGHYKKRDKFSPAVIIMSFIYKYLTEELQAGGFYVEVGLNHGLLESKSLRLDIIYKWKGLLVESNKQTYKTLRHTKRHAKTASFCISPKRYSMFKSDNQTSNMGLMDSQHKIECYPLLSVLEAVTKKNRAVVDFMSLTTGGTELEIMKTLPEELVIKLLYIDHRYIVKGFEDIHDYMERRQYTWVHGVKENNEVVGSIFVHNQAFSKSI